MHLAHAHALFSPHGPKISVISSSVVVVRYPRLNMLPKKLVLFCIPWPLAAAVAESLGGGAPTPPDGDGAAPSPDDGGAAAGEGLLAATADLAIFLAPSQNSSHEREPLPSRSIACHAAWMRLAGPLLSHASRAALRACPPTPVLPPSLRTRRSVNSA